MGRQQYINIYIETVLYFFSLSGASVLWLTQTFSSSERECFQRLSNPLGGLSSIVIAFQTAHLKALYTSSEEWSECPGGKVDRQKQEPEGCCHAAEGKKSSATATAAPGSDFPALSAQRPAVSPPANTASSTQPPWSLDTFPLSSALASLKVKT